MSAYNKSRCGGGCLSTRIWWCRTCRDKNLVIQAVKELPRQLSPPLFMEAFTRAHTEVLKAMMQNLHKLLLSHISGPACISTAEWKQLITIIHFSFSQVAQLEEEICRPSLSWKVTWTIHLSKMGCLTFPLETLAVTHCQLSRSDWEHLSQCLSISQVKHLYLKGVRLTV
ncbi:PRAME family member 12-like [Heterocephalus glaber]|uniref:PRAME family member 12-like n=1 Tax=Heterocephalus glaber TaxID=10181 RepID=A0AAX6RRP0_HETGA|nr:PRAME family member 12-like [Heterocephalus glaber]